MRGRAIEISRSRKSHILAPRSVTRAPIGMPSRTLKLAIDFRARRSCARCPDRRTARTAATRAEVDRELQGARGHADRGARDAARGEDVGLPRPADLDRPAAHPRLSRARPGLVRRARELLAGDS